MSPSFISIVVFSMTCGCILCDDVGNSTKKFILKTELKANWFRANHYCMINDMHLASISSKEENEQVQKQIKESGFVERFWIGGINLGNEPNFYWMGNKNSITFTDWLENEPNNAGGNENCIEIRTQENYKWNDGKCWELNYFICEKI